jgi:hypothetical protein
VQVDDGGRPEPLDREPPENAPTLPDPWNHLRDRALRLLAVRN